MHSLASMAGITSVSGSISTPNRSSLEGGERLAELRAAAVRRVPMVGWIGHGALHRLHDVRIGRAVRVADPEADHVHTPLALLRDSALELGEHVRGHDRGAGRARPAGA